MMILGIAFIAIVCGMALMVTNPPAGFVPAETAPIQVKKSKSSSVVNMTPKEVLRDKRLYLLWIAFFVGAGAGLMVIGSVAGIAKKSMGEYAFIAVAVMAIGNASGRIVAGILSDKIGRVNTLMIMLVFQAMLMFSAIWVVGGNHGGAVLVTLLATFMGFNYGTNLSLFPSFAKDYWGATHYGMNYGILFSAWGIGAFVLVKLSAAITVKTGGVATSFAAAGILLLIGAMIARTLTPPKVADEVVVPVTEAELAVEQARN